MVLAKPGGGRISVVGKRVRGALYVHRSALHLLAPLERERIELAERMADGAVWNVVRLERDVIGLLEYEDFDASVFPALISACRIDMISCTASSRDFRNNSNPLILHRKELMLNPADSRVAEWGKLTSALVARGLFRDSHLIGRRNQWFERLSASGLKITGHTTCPG